MTLIFVPDFKAFVEDFAETRPSNVHGRHERYPQSSCRAQCISYCWVVHLAGRVSARAFKGAVMDSFVTASTRGAVIPLFTAFDQKSPGGTGVTIVVLFDLLVAAHLVKNA
mmetsp:Transcript_11864/g.28402  ORF Transcript_11864/g.28402 Transcript_11864/m.28402 type:complete len:111 (+) Transcript_11864:2972-3304(+)